MDQMSKPAGVSCPTWVKLEPRISAGFWRRWLGPAVLLLAGTAFLTLALTRKPLTVALIPLCGLASVGPATEAPFLTDNDAAMSQMMTGMTIQPTGDVDRDFVAMMIAHHQGAIDMAQALLLYGDNERLRRLAQEIIVTQQQEIGVMRLAVGEPLPPMVAAPDQPSDTVSPPPVQTLKSQ
jgi:hypothetical protein